MRLSNKNYLIHQGVKGMKWGVRRYKNKDNILTYEGLIRQRTTNALKTKNDVDSILSTMPKKDMRLLNIKPGEEYMTKEQGQFIVKRFMQKHGDTPVAFFDFIRNGDDLAVALGTRSGSEYRGKGYAKKLTKKGMDWANKNADKWDNINWNVHAENYGSIKIAKDFNFKKDATVNNKWLNYVYTHVDRKSAKAREVLKQYKEQGITSASLKPYKQENKRLSHIKITKDTEGRMFIKDGKVLAMVNVEKKPTGEKWIQGLEVFGEGKGKGLSYGLLDIGTKDLGANYLAVNKENSLAISLYDKYGFKTYQSTDSMHFMKLENQLTHHGIKGMKWGRQKKQTVTAKSMTPQRWVQTELNKVERSEEPYTKHAARQTQLANMREKTLLSHVLPRNSKEYAMLNYADVIMEKVKVQYTKIDLSTLHTAQTSNEIRHLNDVYDNIKAALNSKDKIMVVHMNDKNVITDGNHRAISLIKMGVSKTPVNYYDYDAYLKANKPISFKYDDYHPDLSY